MSCKKGEETLLLMGHTGLGENMGLERRQSGIKTQNHHQMC